jgi:hypothetical protein
MWHLLFLMFISARRAFLENPSEPLITLLRRLALDTYVLNANKQHLYTGKHDILSINQFSLGTCFGLIILWLICRNIKTF